VSRFLPQRRVRPVKMRQNSFHVRYANIHRQQFILRRVARTAVASIIETNHGVRAGYFVYESCELEAVVANAIDEKDDAILRFGLGVVKVFAVDLTSVAVI
jgi:hypothetical protein